jgi:hypothetical protein
MDATCGDDVTCTAETRDPVWNSNHFCTQTTDHAQHECLCGYTWP